MATVIDSLLVTLGLDPKPYKKGKEDAEKSNKQLAAGTKKAGQEMQASLMAVARQVGLLVLGFESIRGALSFVTGINNADAALGRFAANTGQSVEELNLWGNAVDLIKGDVGAFQKDVMGLSASITALRTQGTASPLIMLMTRLGVAWEDAEGKLKSMPLLLEEIGRGLRERGGDRRNQFNLASDAGLSESTLNVLLLEEDARRRLFDLATKNNNMDAAAAERAQKIETQWRDIGQNMKEFGRELLEAITPFATRLMDAIKPVQETIIDMIDRLNNMGVPEAFASGIVRVANTLIDVLDRWDASTKAEQAQAADQALIERKTGMSPRGSYVWEDISSLWNSDMRQREGEKDSEFASRLANIRQFGSAEAFQAYQDSQRLPGGSNQGATTTVQIDNITVNTQATDADGIAAGMRAAIERKGIINQADSGMQ